MQTKGAFMKITPFWQEWINFSYKVDIMNLDMEVLFQCSAQVRFSSNESFKRITATKNKLIWIWELRTTFKIQKQTFTFSSKYRPKIGSKRGFGLDLDPSPDSGPNWQQ